MSSHFRPHSEGFCELAVEANDPAVDWPLHPLLAGLLHAADERVPVAALDFGTAILTDLLSVYQG